MVFSFGLQGARLATPHSEATVGGIGWRFATEVYM
jgi:hypothetical protein